MKKLLLIFLILAVALCACAKGESLPKTENPTPEKSEPGVTMTATSVTESGCTVFIETDYADAEITTGSAFYLKKDGEKLPTLFPGDQIAWTMEAYLIAPDSVCSIAQNWEYLYGALPGGTYEIVKTVYIELPDGERITKEVSAEFEFALPGDFFEFPLKIVDGAETGNLVLTTGDAEGVFTLDLSEVPEYIDTENIPVFLDGNPADASALEDGMKIEVLFNNVYNASSFPISLDGNVKEIYAYSLGTEKNPGGTYYDLAGLYIHAVKQIWQPDSGLNGGAEILSICFENAPEELTAGEKSAITWILENELEGDFKTVLNLSYDELIKEGYLAPYDDEGRSYWFENGILITVSVAAPGGEDTTIFGLRTLQFNVTKWRSPLGAYMIFDSKAVWPQKGTWEYTEGVHAIS